jgi:hypothetical protein
MSLPGDELVLDLPSESVKLPTALEALSEADDAAVLAACAGSVAAPSSRASAIRRCVEGRRMVIERLL